MKKASVFQKGIPAGYLEETGKNQWSFSYLPDYEGAPISLTMPVRSNAYLFEQFPPVFEGLLPEGFQLEALLRKQKIDRHDHFNQLIVVGEDLVGSLSIKPVST